MIRNGFLSWEEEGEVGESRDENAKSERVQYEESKMAV